MIRSLNVAYASLGVAVLILATHARVEARRRPKGAKQHKGKPSKQIRTDTIKSGEPATIRVGPGDSYKSAGDLPAGTTIVVTALKGRWAQVRRGRKLFWILRRSLTGYQPRTEPTTAAEGARVWGGNDARASFRVQVASDDARLFLGPSLTAEVAGAASRGTDYVVVSRSDDRQWLEVRAPDGRAVWIQSNRVQSNTMADVEADGWSSTASAPSLSAWRKGSLPGLEAATRIGLGYRSISMNHTSDGQGALANTITESQAMAAEGALDLVWRNSSRRVHVGVDGQVRASYAKPGIDVIRDNMSLGDVDFSMYETQGGARVGIVLSDFEISVRAGARYDVFLTRSVDNVGLLPRESLLSVVGGMRVDWYRLAPELVLSVRGEMLVSGRHRQTQGLEDGEETTVKGASGDLRAIYAATRLLDVVATFHYRWTGYSWSGRSERNPDVMQASRSDHAQSLGIGIAHRF